MEVTLCIASPLVKGLSHVGPLRFFLAPLSRTVGTISDFPQCNAVMSSCAPKFFFLPLNAAEASILEAQSPRLNA